MRVALSAYYNSLFPLDFLCTLFVPPGLSIGDVEIIPRWDNNIFRRWRDKDRTAPLRFATPQELRVFLIHETPLNLNIGAPKPLVFDVDMQDYYNGANPVPRSCKCKQKQICDVCWVELLRTPLIELLDFLKTLMLFEKVLPVFSGGNGFHVWVFDARPRTWDDEARENLLKRLPPSVRADAQVTIQQTHLVKMPLVPHQTTGLIAAPIEEPETWVPSMGVPVGRATEEEVGSWTVFMARCAGHEYCPRAQNPPRELGAAGAQRPRPGNAARDYF